ncbi:MAG: MBL fold metallo-hydrolase [Alphaproteobacteria bacterium]|nr:MBL fold metallo-hydrolase [Alphaproteobacteria bacterium]
MYYLRQDVKAEPLIWRWYAWPHLISPVTAGCNISERHLRIMMSYIANPKIHEQAVKDPKMIGGPFIDLGGQQVEEVKKLISYTKEKCKTLIALATQYKEFDKKLLAEGKGGSLEFLYPQIPEMLKGMIELVYDLNSQPSIRLIESLIYKSYYDDSDQQIALGIVTEDFRKFVFSTPRIYQEDEVYLDASFSDRRLDKLFRMKQEPGDFDEIANTFQISESKKNLFYSFFTKNKPLISEDNNYFGKGVRIRYFGHACILIETKDITILIDPVISYDIKNEIPRYSFKDLPTNIDYIIITHNHLDHVMFEAILQLRHKTSNIIFSSNNDGCLADPSLKLVLQNIGFSNLIELKEFENVLLSDGEIIALPFFGEHCDLNINSKRSYCVSLKGKKFLFAADSNNLDPYMYKHIAKYIGPIEIIFIGMECEGAPLTWTYGPLLTHPLSRVNDNSRTLSGSNCEKAWTIVEDLKCKYAYIYAMGQEPWLNHVMALNYSTESKQIIESDKFVERCKNNGIESERLFGKKLWEFKNDNIETGA